MTLTELLSKFRKKERPIIVKAGANNLYSVKMIDNAKLMLKLYEETHR